MKARLPTLSLAMLLALAVSESALAQHQGRGGRGGGQQQKPQQQQAQRPPPPQGPQQRDATYRQAQPQRQGNRMSDEERQQLRRDISDHGRDIYQDRGSRR